VAVPLNVLLKEKHGKWKKNNMNTTILQTELDLLAPHFLNSIPKNILKTQYI
jgi:hypothetical protein